MFASKSLPRHLLRGTLGAGAFAAAYYGTEISIAAWLFVPAALFAWRGCPTCWAIGLYQTTHNALSQRKLERQCVDGRCELTDADKASGPGVPINSLKTGKPGRIDGTARPVSVPAI